MATSKPASPARVFPALIVRLLAMLVLALLVNMCLIVAPVVAGWYFNPFCNPFFFVCAKLDKEGQYGACVFNCPIDETRFVEYQGQAQGGVTSYEFLGKSSYQAVGTGACPPGIKKIKGVGIWQQGQGLSGIATEEIWMEQQFVTGGWSNLVTTKSSCTANPWLSVSTTCTVISKDPAASSFPEPYPRSGHILIDAMRESLIRAEFLQTPPVILSPASSSEEIQGGKFIFSAHKYVPVDTTIGKTQIEVVFEIPAWPGSSEGEKITELVDLHNNFAFKEIPLTNGSWTVRARVRSDKGSGPWSAYLRTVKVTGAQVSPKYISPNYRDFHMIPPKKLPDLIPPK
jgi:hypothetical protein